MSSMNTSRIRPMTTWYAHTPGRTLARERCKWMLDEMISDPPKEHGRTSDAKSFQLSVDLTPQLRLWQHTHIHESSLMSRARREMKKVWIATSKVSCVFCHIMKRKKKNRFCFSSNTRTRYTDAMRNFSTFSSFFRWNKDTTTKEEN